MFHLECWCNDVPPCMHRIIHACLQHEQLYQIVPCSALNNGLVALMQAADDGRDTAERVCRYTDVKAGHGWQRCSAHSTLHLIRGPPPQPHHHCQRRLQPTVAHQLAQAHHPQEPQLPAQEPGQPRGPWQPTAQDQLHGRCHATAHPRQPWELVSCQHHGTGRDYCGG